MNKLDWKSKLQVCVCCGQCTTWTDGTNIHATRRESQRCNTNYIFQMMSTSLWCETGPKEWNQEKVSAFSWCLNIQNSENAKFWTISFRCIYSVSPDCWQTMAHLARLRANWLLFVKLPLYKRNNASILPQVFWMQPGRHTWAPWSLAVYRLWCMVQLFPFVSVSLGFFCFFVFCIVSFQGLSSCQEYKKEIIWPMESAFRFLTHGCAPLTPTPHHHPTHPPLLPEEVKGLSLWSFELHCMIYMHSCI